MGKPSPGSVNDHLIRMSSTSSSLKVNRIGPTAAAANGAWKCSMENKIIRGGDSIPKFFIQKVSEPQSLQSPVEKKKMVDGLIKRLSLGGLVNASSSSNTDIPDYAAKEFRKRSSSSSLGEGSSGPKVFVVDNSEQVPGMLQTPVISGPSSCMSVFKSKKCDKMLRKFNRISSDDAASPPRSQSPKNSSPPPPPPHPSHLPAPKPEPQSSVPARLKNAASTEHLLTTVVKVEGKERPNVKTPPISSYFRKPRTVAEKRLFLDQSPIQYKILDNENTIYHLVKKMDRFKLDPTFRVQVELLMYTNVPMNRNIWRAMLWLNHEVGNYTRIHLSVDGERVRLMGAMNCFNPDDADPVSSGDLYKAPRQYQPSSDLVCCWDKAITLKKLKNEKAILGRIHDLEMGIIPSFKSSPGNPKQLLPKRPLDDAHTKPGPLSAKVRRLQKEKSESHLGPVEIFELPVETITAVPELNKKQSRRVCSYLKLALPEDKLTKDWLNYSLSVLQPSTTTAAEESEEPEKKRENTQEKVAFKFPIPYKNNQRKILVRRVTRGRRGEVRLENYDRQMKYQLTFPAVAAKEQESDQVDKEVAEILTEMIDSVAMSFSQDFFTREDPDLSYCVEKPLAPAKPTPLAESAQTGLTLKQRKSSHQLNRELKRLNVTIIDTAKIRRPAICKRDECHFGCICDSISKFDASLPTTAKHCTNAECIFECRCDSSIGDDDEAQRLFRMRDEKISGLARAEKDFTSTLVLTNSDTILMRNSSEGKRRTVKPKRFSDFTTDDVVEEVAASGAQNETIPAPPPPPKEKRWHPAVEQLLHCAVTLPEIPCLGQLEKWCMIHELYYCFCEGQATEGRRFKMKARADGTVKFNTQLPLASSFGRRVFAKDEKQDALERIPERLRPDEPSCSRCAPYSFVHAFERNRKNAAVVRQRVETARRDHKQRLLEQLVEKCVNQRPVVVNRGGMKVKSSHAQQKSLKRLQMVEDAGNELGLKITSVRTLEGDGEAEEEAEGRSYEERLKELKRTLLMKLNSLLASMGRRQIHLPALRTVDFMSYKDVAALMTTHGVYEVWRHERPVEIIMSEEKVKRLQEFYPSPACRLVNIVTAPQTTLFYLSRFLLDKNNLRRSSHIYVVVEGSGQNYWYLRGCQFIRDPQQKIRILPEHTDCLKEYARSGGPLAEAQTTWPATTEEGQVAAALSSSSPVRNKPEPVISNLSVLHFHGGGLNVKLPEYTDKRYAMILMEDDFSDLSHPSWKGLLAFSHIDKALALARKSQRTIKVIRSEDNLQPNIFATPHYARRIFAGPFDKDVDCEITLYQRVDNSLYLREEYEAILGLERGPRTRGFWLTSEHLSGTMSPPSLPSSSDKGGSSSSSSSRTSDKGSAARRWSSSSSSSAAAVVGAVAAATAAAEVGETATSSNSVKMEIVEVPGGVAGEVTVETASGVMANVLTELEIIPIAKNPKLICRESLEDEEKIQGDDEDEGMAEEDEVKHNPEQIPPQMVPQTKVCPKPPVIQISITRDARQLPIAKTTLKPPPEPMNRSLLKPMITINRTSGPTQNTSSFLAFADIMKNSELSTFKVGNTVVQRYARGQLVDDAIAGSSKAPDPPAPVKNVVKMEAMRVEEAKITEVAETVGEVNPEREESDDEDCIFIEDPEAGKIIDLDEWERVQQECSGDEGAMTNDEEGDEVEEVRELLEEEQEQEQEPEESTIEPQVTELIPEKTDSLVTNNENEVERFQRLLLQQEEVAETVPVVDHEITRTDSIPHSGYFESNIPALGNIPAKILNGVVTMNLPFRKMPIKIGATCIDRYMLRYMQNIVSACIPQNLAVKWTFVKSRFPLEKDLFKLEPTDMRKYLILTPYGVINVLGGPKTYPEDIKDHGIYLKYLAARLCCVVFHKLGSYSSDMMVEKALQVIKGERYKILKNSREIALLKAKQRSLRLVLEEKQSGSPCLE